MQQINSSAIEEKSDQINSYDFSELKHSKIEIK